MITVLGASGFIGSHLVAHLRREGMEVYAPDRDTDLTDRPLGTVIYSIGVTSDFRSRPFDTVNAHVCKLSEVLQHTDFETLTYLSSARIYQMNLPLAAETVDLQVNSQNPSDLYNLSKLMGESLALHSGRNVRVVRISHVYGDDFTSDNFLPSVLRDAVKGKVVLRTSLDSAKDYVSIEDVVSGILKIACEGTQSVYNLASGCSISNGQLAEHITRLTGCTFEVLPDAPTLRYPPMSIARMQQEFDFSPSDLLDDFARLIDQFRLRYL